MVRGSQSHLCTYFDAHLHITGGVVVIRADAGLPVVGLGGVVNATMSLFDSPPFSGAGGTIGYPLVLLVQPLDWRR